MKRCDWCDIDNVVLFNYDGNDICEGCVISEIERLRSLIE